MKLILCYLLGLVYSMCIKQLLIVVFNKYQVLIELFKSYVLTDFLSTFLSSWEKSVEISRCYCGFVYFFLQFYQFLLQVFWSSVIRCIYIEDCYVSEWTDLCNLIQFPSFYLVILCVPKLVMSDINVCILLFSRLMFAWCIYFLSFYFKLFLYKFISFKQHISSFDWTINPFDYQSFFWLDCLYHLHLI